MSNVTLFLGLGLALMILEVIAPGFFMLWLGIAALVTGGIAFLVPLSLQTGLILFGVLSVVTTVIGPFVYQHLGTPSNEGLLNRRGESLVGQILTLESAIKNGKGSIKIGDSPWAIRCDIDLPSNTKVKVIAIDGNHLVVVKV